MNYDGSYVDAFKAEAKLGVGAPEYSFDLGDEGDSFNKLPPFDVIRFVSDMDDLDALSLVAKKSISGKKVVLRVDGEAFGSGFLVKGIDYDWDQFPEFIEHPMALMELFKITSSALLKNSKLLHRKSPEATASTTGN